MRACVGFFFSLTLLCVSCCFAFCLSFYLLLLSSQCSKCDNGWYFLFFIFCIYMISNTDTVFNLSDFVVIVVVASFNFAYRKSQEFLVPFCVKTDREIPTSINHHTAYIIHIYVYLYFDCGVWCVCVLCVSACVWCIRRQTKKFVYSRRTKKSTVCH